MSELSRRRRIRAPSSASDDEDASADRRPATTSGRSGGATEKVSASADAGRPTHQPPAAGKPNNGSQVRGRDPKGKVAVLPGMTHGLEWPRGMGLKRCAEVISLLIRDLGAKPETVQYFRASWNSHVQATGKNRCGGGHEKLSGGCRNPVHRQHLAKLIQLLYVAILQAGDRIEMFDILRWLREQHLPGTLMSLYLPEGVYLNREDSELFVFSSARDVPSGLVKATGALIGLSEYPKRDMKFMLPRFILEYQLPMELYGYIQDIGCFEDVFEISGRNNSFQKIPDSYLARLKNSDVNGFNFSCASIPYPEMRVVSVLLITLKMLFGMDDLIENELGILGAKLSEELSKVAGQDRRAPTQIFNINEWMDVIDQRHSLMETLCPFSLSSCAGPRHEPFLAGSPAVLHRRVRCIEGCKFRSQIKQPKGPSEPTTLVDKESRSPMPDIRKLINGPQRASALNGQAAAFFRPSMFPGRSFMDTLMAIRPALEELQRLPENQHMRIEPELDRVHRNIQQLKTLTKHTLQPFANPQAFRAGLEKAGIWSDACTSILYKLEEKVKEAETKYWIYTSTKGVLKKDRTSSDSLEKHLPRNFHRLLQIFAGSLACSLPELYAECEIVEVLALKQIGVKKSSLGHVLSGVGFLKLLGF